MAGLGHGAALRGFGIAQINLYVNGVNFYPLFMGLKYEKR